MTMKNVEECEREKYEFVRKNKVEAGLQQESKTFLFQCAFLKLPVHDVRNGTPCQDPGRGAGPALRSGPSFTDSVPYLGQAGQGPKHDETSTHTRLES